MENMLSCPEVTYTCKKITVNKIITNYKDVQQSTRKSVGCSRDGYNRFKPVFEEFIQHHEEVWVMYLNGGNGVLGMSCSSVGGLDSAIVDVRAIFQTALLVNAKNIMIAHNHPSGTLSPSTYDEAITKKIAEAGKILDIKLLDHLILTYDSYYSFADEGLLR